MESLRTQLEVHLSSLLALVPSRQRPLLFIGLGLFSLLLVWLVLLAPLAASRSALRKEIAVKEQDLAWMQAAAMELRQSAMSSGRGSSSLSAIDSRARQFGLGQAMQRIEPGDGHEVRVWLEGAVFDDLLRWLALLKQGHGIEVAEIVVEPGRSGSSLVNARLTLTGGF